MSNKSLKERILNYSGGVIVEGVTTSFEGEKKCQLLSLELMPKGLKM